jgi:hypothetical protein
MLTLVMSGALAGESQRSALLVHYSFISCCLPKLAWSENPRPCSAELLIGVATTGVLPGAGAAARYLQIQAVHEAAANGSWSTLHRRLLRGPVWGRVVLDSWSMLEGRSFIPQRKELIRRLAFSSPQCPVLEPWF